MFLHTYHPQSVIFSIGKIQFYWYGLCVSLGIVSGLIVVQKLAEKYKINKEKILDFAIYIIVFAFLGARIYDVLLELPYYLNHPLNVFKFWRGGLAIHGGIIGALLASFLYFKRGYFQIPIFANFPKFRLRLVEKILSICHIDKFFSTASRLKFKKIHQKQDLATTPKKFKLKFWLTADIAVVGLALGQAIGRWGNYFNQELYGLPTNLPWGIPIDQSHRSNFLYQNAEFFHPTFLYESILNFLNFLLLLYLHKKRLSQKHKNKFLATGNIFLIYLMNYGLIRFFLEFIKIDKTPLVFGVRFPQLVSLLLFIFIVLALSYRIKKIKN